MDVANGCGGAEAVEETSDSEATRFVEERLLRRGVEVAEVVAEGVLDDEI